MDRADRAAQAVLCTVNRRSSAEVRATDVGYAYIGAVVAPLLDAMAVSFCSCVRYALVSSHGGSPTGGGASNAGKQSVEPFYLMFVGLSLSVTDVPILIGRFQTRVARPVGSVDSVL